MNRYSFRFSKEIFSLLFVLFELICLLVPAADAEGQCVRFRTNRRNTAFTLTPKKEFKCLAINEPPVTTFTITFESPVSNLVINWGPTGADSTYAGPRTTASFIYQDTGVFEYKITHQDCPTQTKGYFVNLRNNFCPPGMGWSFPPSGSAKCLPANFSIVNNSSGQSPFTEWIINWGDNTRDTIDYPSNGKIVTHEYVPNKRICNPIVTVNYRYTCGAVPSGCGPVVNGSAGPYSYRDRDTALISPATALICSPTAITINDISLSKNCPTPPNPLDTANRQVNWTNLAGFTGPLPNPGDDIWRPRGPAGNKKIVIPAEFFNTIPTDSLYKVRFRIRNQCGIDTADAEIRRIAPNQPKFRVATPDGCAGSPIIFENQTFERYGTMRYIWIFGDGKIDSTFTGNASHVYQNSGKFIIKLIARTIGFGGKFCSLETIDSVIVKPAVLPRIQASSSDGCDSMNVTLKNVSLFTNNVRWQGWEFGGTPVITGDTNYFPGPQSSNPSIVSVLQTNPLDSSAQVRFKRYGLYKIYLTGTTQGCGRNRDSTFIRIQPSPRLRYRISSTNLCQGEPFFIFDSSRVLVTDPRGLPSNFNHIRWSVKVGNDTVINSAFPITGSFDTRRTIPLTFKNIGTFFVKITVTAGNGCPVSDSVQVTVKGSAVPRMTLGRKACASDSITLRNNTIENASKYIYRIYKGNGLLIGQELQAFTVFNKDDFKVTLPYVPPGDSTIYFVTLTAITYTGSDSCVATANPQVIKVGPTPVAALNVSPQDGCTPLNNVSVQNTSFNLPFNGNATFNWQLGSLGEFTGNNPPPLTFINEGITNKRDTIRLCIRTGNNCNFCKEAVVLTYPSPKGTINAPDSICSGETINLSANTVGAVGFNWEFTDYDGSSAAQQSLSKQFNNATGVPRIYTLRLILRSTADCPTILEKSLKVNPNPEFGFQSITSQEQNCGFLRSKFYYLSDTNVAVYKWNFGSNDSLITSSRDTVVRNFGNETSAQIQLPVRLTGISIKGCSTSTSTFLPVNPLVRARFKLSADSGCTPLKMVLTDSSTLASNVRRWLINGTAIPNQGQVLNYLFENQLLVDSVFTIQLAVRNDLGFNCIDTATRRVKIFSRPRSNDLIVSPSEGCSPLIVNFTGNTENAVSFRWNFGDGTDTVLTGQTLSHTFINNSPTVNQTYTISRVASSQKGCTDTTIRQVVAKPRTEAIISSFTTSGCSPLQVSLSAANSINFSTVEWNFGDNSPSSTALNPNHTFINNSDSVRKFRVRLIAVKNQVNSCPDTAFLLITVNPGPSPGFSMSSSIGCGPLSDTLKDLSSGGATSFWTFNSAGVSSILVPGANGLADTLIENPNFITKTLQVIQTVITAQGCSASTTQTIQVYPNLTAEFNFDTSRCHPHLVKFVNTSENFLGTYNWSFGNGNTSAEKNPIQLYENFTDRDTSFQVRLTSVSPVGGCTRTRTRTVRVYATPRADFVFLSDSSIQLPVNTITIGNRTRFRESWKFKWTFDDNSGISTDSSASFVHTFNLGSDYFVDTNFVISMIATGPRGCSDTLRKTMAVIPGKPVAAFDVSPRIICAGKQVQFTNLSSFASEWEWTYRDSDASPNIKIKNGNPAVVFGSAGRKTIKLKVKGLGGSDSLTKFEHVYVYAKPSSYFEILPTNKSVVSPEDEATFFEIPPCDDTSGCKFVWNFGDGTGDTLFDNQPVNHRYLSPGVYKVSLIVTNSLGCSSVLTRDSVRAVPARDISIPNAFIPLSYPGGCPIDNFRRLPPCIFYPMTSGMISLNIQIFNRWGLLLFESDEIGKGWDGFYENQPVPGDTYMYKIVAEFTNGDVQTLTGDVTVIR